MSSASVRKDNWNPHLYDHHHSFVSKYGNSLLELLAAKEGERVLDLGCGTGDLAKDLYDAGVHVMGIDNSENMINEALAKYPDIPFFVKDATNFHFKEPFDAVFTNATLHWVKPPEQALSCIHNCLREGGRFVAEFGGKGNVNRIVSEIIQQIQRFGFDFRYENYPWFYPSIGEYSTLMENAGFRVTFAQHYDRPTRLDGEAGLKHWINMFGMQLFEGINPDQVDLIISQVENSLRPSLYKEDYWEADYKRIRVIGIKESNY